MTGRTNARLTRDEVLALRGLRLPSTALKGLQRAGIYCQPAISIEFSQTKQDYVIRGVESGGAIAHIGAYCGFVDDAGFPLPVFQAVHTVGVNGLHATALASSLVRVHMFRAGTTYELLLTRHALVPVDDKTRPTFQNFVLFHGRHGTLDMDLWQKDSQFRGIVAPVFYDKSGQQIAPSDLFHDAVLRASAGVCCCGCRHTHLLGSGPLTHWR
jgi:hypothetical protein